MRPSAASAPDTQKEMIMSTSQSTKFHVEIEGGARQTFDSPAEALAYAGAHVYLPPERANDAERLLLLGQIVMYSYGFTSVNIVPVTP
jgi:hypothetical protein